MHVPREERRSQRSREMRNVDSENFLKRVREDYGGIKLDELSVRECFINPMFCRVEICGVKKWVFTEKSGVRRERRVKKKRKERERVTTYDPTG